MGKIIEDKTIRKRKVAKGRRIGKEEKKEGKKRIKIKIVKDEETRRIKKEKRRN